MALIVLVILLVWVSAKTKTHLLCETILCLPIFVCLFASLSHLNICLPWNHYALCIPLTVVLLGSVALSVRLELRKAGLPHVDQETCILWIFSLALVGLWTYAFFGTMLLPGHDPLITINYSKLLTLHNRLPDSLEPVNDIPFTYPPGLAILLYPFWAFSSPVIVLLAAKVVYLFSMALTPIVAAWAITANAKGSTRHLLLVAMAVTVGYLLLDRSLFLAAAYAGKNSQTVATFFLILLIGYLLRSPLNIRTLLIGATSACGIFLTQYSSLYMLAFWLAGYGVVYVRILRHDLKLPVLSATAGAVFFLPHVWMTVNKGLDLTHHDNAFDGKAFLISLFHVWGDRTSDFMYIFHFVHEWAYKGVVVFFLGMGIIVLFVTARKHLSSPWSVCLKNSLAAWIGLAITSICAAGHLPYMYLDQEYARWFAFHFMAVVFAITCLPVFVIVSRVAGRKRNGQAAVCAGMAILTIFLARIDRDFHALRRKVKWDSYSLKDINTVSSALNGIPRFKHCFLIADTAVQGEKMAYYNYAGKFGRGISYAVDKLLNYAFVFSDCFVINGSWGFEARPETRTFHGLPGKHFFETADQDQFPFVLALRPETRADMQRHLPTYRFVPTESNLCGNPVWLLYR